MNGNKIINLAIVVLILVAGWFFLTATNQRQQTNLLRIADKTLTVKIADSPSEIQKGLSNDEKLKDNEGMYFVLGERKVAEFWMKDMRFPIDIIWIDSGKVVGFVENAPIPDGQNIPSFTSQELVTNVLEVNAGFVKNNSIKKGDSVSFQN